MTLDTQQEGAIPTNLRLLVVLEEVARAGVPVTPTEVNQVLGLPKPTIHRLFATLEAEGFLRREIDGKGYSPGTRLRSLSGGVMSSLPIRSARLAIMQELSREVGETCNIALPDREAMVYIERVQTEWPLRIQLPIGTRVPFHCTASGKMYLSTLERRYRDRLLDSVTLEARTPHTLTDRAGLEEELRAIRRQGYATDREEFMVAMIALAVPIAGPEGRLMATLSFHAPTQRFDMDRAREYLPALRRASAALAGLVTG